MPTAVLPRVRANCPSNSGRRRTPSTHSPPRQPGTEVSTTCPPLTWLVRPLLDRSWASSGGREHGVCKTGRVSHFPAEAKTRRSASPRVCLTSLVCRVRLDGPGWKEVACPIRDRAGRPLYPTARRPHGPGGAGQLHARPKRPDPSEATRRNAAHDAPPAPTPRGLQEADPARAFQAAWEAGWHAGRSAGWQQSWDLRSAVAVVVWYLNWRVEL
jgi:hypothetical protein